MDIERINSVLTRAIVGLQESEIEGLLEYDDKGPRAKPYDEANFIASSKILSDSLASMVNYLSGPIAAWKKELSGMGGYEKSPSHAPRAAVNSIDKLQGLIDRITGVKKDSKMDDFSDALTAIQKRNWAALDRLMKQTTKGSKVKAGINHLARLLDKIGFQAGKVKKNVHKHLKQPSKQWSDFETGINLVYHDNNPALTSFQGHLDSYIVSRPWGR